MLVFAFTWWTDFRFDVYYGRNVPGLPFSELTAVVILVTAPFGVFGIISMMKMRDDNNMRRELQRRYEILKLASPEEIKKMAAKEFAKIK